MAEGYGVCMIEEGETRPEKDKSVDEHEPSPKEQAAMIPRR